MNAIFNNFKKNILKEDTKEVTIESISLDNLKRSLVIISLFCILIYTVQIVRSIIDGYFAGPGFLETLGELIGIVVSICMIIIVKTDKLNKHTQFFKISILIFYLSFSVTSGLLSYSIYVRYPDYSGIPLSTLMYMVLLMFPLDSFFYSALVVASMFAQMACFIHMLTPMSIFIHVFLRIIFSIGYYYLRSNSLRSAKEKLTNYNLNQQLYYTSYTDGLTSVLNKNALKRYEAILISKKASICSIILDIDDFKFYNDNYSHIEGDNILVVLIQAVASCLNEDQYLFRFGGEEFVVITENLDEQALLDTASCIINKINDLNICYEVGDITKKLTLSLGVAYNMTIENYIAKADEQLYIAKNQNKNCFSYNGKITRPKTTV